MAEAGGLTKEELARFDAESVAALQDAIVKERARYQALRNERMVKSEATRWAERALPRVRDRVTMLEAHLEQRDQQLRRARSLLKRMRLRMQVWERALEEIIPKRRSRRG